MPEKCWCGKAIHYCDDGLPNGRVACDCSTVGDHNTANCGYCSGDEIETHEPATAPGGES
jgi:hypothetical protein